MISTLSSNAEAYADLPRDVFHDIFLRLPYKYVYRFRCVSKSWLTLLSDASLVKRVFKNTTSILNQSPVSHIQLFQTSSSQKLHHETHDGFRFHLLLDSSIWRLRLLASCNNGLVLYSTRRWRCYYVFNPLTKQRVSLPRRPKQDMGNVGYTRLVSECSISNLTACNYKVVFIPVFAIDDHYFSFQIFSSETGEWNIHRIRGSKGIFTSYSDMIIHNGVLYWTDEDGRSNKNIIRAYNLNHEDQCNIIELPAYWPIHKNGFFGESEGSIYYGHIDRTRDTSAFLSVWMLDEGDDYSNVGWVWRLVRQNIELEGHVSSEKVGGMLKFFNPVDRNAVIFASDSCCLVYNIETGRSEVLHSSSIASFKTNATVSSSPLLITQKPTVIPSLP